MLEWCVELSDNLFFDSCIFESIDVLYTFINISSLPFCKILNIIL
ncbi:hypothetical protein HPMG_01460 [Helicobacter pullorum MIT 98-5489]|uniref:Uncharacterized protein n=1 Tax=Helicobacter pullorum MIT 98-5489 TaxID=537972 RepID=C5F0J0_9HELI|nr:hypothetical protein HPMG_01460 [Helicobacter pullorum MIT 98-5489]